MRGIYALHFYGDQGVAVGGEWGTDSCDGSRAYSSDAGQTWIAGRGINQYRSGTCALDKDVWIACGTSGIDLSLDGGASWQQMDSTHFYTLHKVGAREAVASGPQGSFARIRVLEQE